MINTMTQRKILLRELDALVQPISVDDDISDESIQKCYEVLSELISLINRKNNTSLSTEFLTAEQLINKLKTYPKDLKVLVDGYEDGLEPVIDICTTTVKYDATKEWYYGPYEEVADSDTNAIKLISARGQRS